SQIGEFVLFVNGVNFLVAVLHGASQAQQRPVRIPAFCIQFGQEELEASTVLWRRHLRRDSKARSPYEQIGIKLQGMAVCFIGLFPFFLREIDGAEVAVEGSVLFQLDGLLIFFHRPAVSLLLVPRRAQIVVSSGEFRVELDRTLKIGDTLANMLTLQLPM